MLSFLQIRNYAIVDSLDLEFAEGFTCVTGETGAGKSILVDALGLLCGKRADTSAIRKGAEKAELNAEFVIGEDSSARRWLSDADLANGDTCLLRRVISENGRSRAWINGTAVTLQQLDSLGERLVEIHGQNEHMLLVRRDEQLRLLDGSGGYEKQLAQVGQCHQAWAALNQEKHSLVEEIPLDAGDLELMRYQIQELESSIVPVAQFTAMEAEHRMLAQGGSIVEALDETLQSMQAEGSGVGPVIHRAVERLDKHSGLDSDISAAVGLLREASINLDEAQNSIQSALARLDLSPERLAELDRVLGLQHDLARKHRVEPEQLQKALEQMTERCEQAGTLEARLALLDSELADALIEYRKAARSLHGQRKSRATALAQAVTVLMQELGMEGGEFEFEVLLDEDSVPGPKGSEQLELRVSANPGTPPGLLRKVASGGELSRISLAIKVAAKAGSAAPTQIFDEVDAGIGGDTANAVGALLKSLSANGQALCVTHLAQVAACADQQLQVNKYSENADTRVETSLLAENDRIDEIARMLGGRVSEQSRAHASELLATASTRH
jgi:DNA repair protein RecN (Recombination protein N)